MLDVKNLKIYFDHAGNIVKAVGGIDFSLNENEVLGIVGESGSGKTVTALSIMRLLPERNTQISGEIIFNGKDVLKATKDECLLMRGSRVAMIFQEPFTSLNPVLRVGEQIGEAIAAHAQVSKKEIKPRALELLRKVKIKDPERIYDSYPHLLSGGERQRAMIAMAVSMNPRILIADEPTTALDVTIQKDILDLILALKKEIGMSVIFITHDFGIIEKVADRVAVMKNGAIVEKGSKLEVLSAPKHEYTKRLLAAVPKIQVRPEKPVSAKTIMQIKDLSKSFFTEKGIFKTKDKEIKALNNITIEIKEGRTLGLVGESGSGKSTLAKALMGLIKPDSGKVGACPRMQIVFQDPFSSLDPKMRMGSIVLEGLTIAGAKRKEKEKTLKEVLAGVQLDYKDRFKYPHQFSGGQRQRIAIARALAVNPRILILDEPVSSLDVIIQSEILKLLKELQDKLALTYVFISHDLRVVEYMSDEVAVMENGKIVELASRNAIYQSPQHPYTKKLLASTL